MNIHGFVEPLFIKNRIFQPMNCARPCWHPKSDHLTITQPFKVVEGPESKGCLILRTRRYVPKCGRLTSVGTWHSFSPIPPRLITGAVHEVARCTTPEAQATALGAGVPPTTVAAACQPERTKWQDDLTARVPHDHPGVRMLSSIVCNCGATHPQNEVE